MRRKIVLGLVMKTSFYVMGVCYNLGYEQGKRDIEDISTISCGSSYSVIYEPSKARECSRMLNKLENEIIKLFEESQSEVRK